MVFLLHSAPELSQIAKCQPNIDGTLFASFPDSNLSQTTHKSALMAVNGGLTIAWF